MPAYLYTCCKCAQTTQRITTVAKLRKHVKCPTCGDVAHRDFVAEHRGFAHKPGNWPMRSDAAGVLPIQIGEAREESIKRGVPTEFTKDGQAIFTSAEHRKKYCESHGMYDRNGGYGDPQRR